MKILVTLPEGDIRDTFITPVQKEELAALGEVVYNPFSRHYEDDELRDALVGVDYVFTGWGTHKLTEEVLSKADKLKMICHVGGTVKPYVSEEAYAKGIKVISGNEIYAKSVAEGVIAYLLCVLRRLPYYESELKKGNWPETFKNRGLIGRSIGLVGFGAITKLVIPMLRLFDMKIKVYSRYLTDEQKRDYGIEYADVEEIFKTCDIVSLHSAYTPSTHHMITGDHMRSMKKDAILLNTARGPIVDEEAMVEVLHERPDLIAVLDVYGNEPLSAGDPILLCENTFTMPHQGGPTIDMRGVVTSALVRNIISLENGKPLDLEITWEQCQKQTA